MDSAQQDAQLGQYNIMAQTNRTVQGKISY